MFENLDQLDNGECPEMYNLPGECFPNVKPNRTAHDNLELLESKLDALSLLLKLVCG
jgi:hypothetical protein